MDSELHIVIPTTGSSTTLEATLESLLNSKTPDNLKKVWIVENGPFPKWKEAVEGFGNTIEIEYLYLEEGNKSKALNEAIGKIDAGLILFFDDDIRIGKDTLIKYATVADRFNGFYYCGPVCIDYEETPEDWLLPYLPTSVKGWSLGGENLEFEKPLGLGCNWAIFAEDLSKVGGFDPNYGPGSTSGARGQETEMQKRLLEYGVKGCYLPEAYVWHYVPRERCSFSWLEKRNIYHGISNGYVIKQKRKLIKIINIIIISIKISICLILCGFFNLFSIEKKYWIKWMARKSFFLGTFKGIFYR